MHAPCQFRRRIYGTARATLSGMDPILKPGPRDREASETERVNFFIPRDLRQRVGRFAERNGIREAEAFRRLVLAGLALTGRDPQ